MRFLVSLGMLIASIVCHYIPDPGGTYLAAAVWIFGVPWVIYLTWRLVSAKPRIR